MTRLGDFWKFLTTNFLTKVAQKFRDILASWESSTFLEKTAANSFAKIELQFIPISGHTRLIMGLFFFILVIVNTPKRVDPDYCRCKD